MDQTLATNKIKWKRKHVREKRCNMFLGHLFYQKHCWKRENVLNLQKMLALNFGSNRDNTVFYETRFFLCQWKEYVETVKKSFHVASKTNLTVCFMSHSNKSTLFFFSSTGITIMALALKKAVHTTTLCILEKA